MKKTKLATVIATGLLLSCGADISEAPLEQSSSSKGNVFEPKSSSSVFRSSSSTNITPSTDGKERSDLIKKLCVVAEKCSKVNINGMNCIQYFKALYSQYNTPLKEIQDDIELMKELKKDCEKN